MNVDLLLSLNTRNMWSYPPTPFLPLLFHWSVLPISQAPLCERVSKHRFRTKFISFVTPPGLICNLATKHKPRPRNNAFIRSMTCAHYHETLSPESVSHARCTAVALLSCFSMSMPLCAPPPLRVPWQHKLTEEHEENGGGGESKTISNVAISSSHLENSRRLAGTTSSGRVWEHHRTCTRYLCIWLPLRM